MLVAHDPEQPALHQDGGIEEGTDVLRRQVALVEGRRARVVLGIVDSQQPVAPQRLEVVGGGIEGEEGGLPPRPGAAVVEQGGADAVVLEEPDCDPGGVEGVGGRLDQGPEGEIEVAGHPPGVSDEGVQGRLV